MLIHNQQQAWAHQFAIEGRKSYSAVFVFQRSPSNFIFAAGKCSATLEGKLNNEDKWKVLLTFDLQTPDGCVQTLNSGRLIAYDNDPDRE